MTSIVQTSYSQSSDASAFIIMNDLEMVEAAGVEPASETTHNREHSCFSSSSLSHYRHLERAKM